MARKARGRAISPTQSSPTPATLAAAAPTSANTVPRQNTRRSTRLRDPGSGNTLAISASADSPPESNTEVVEVTTTVLDQAGGFEPPADGGPLIPQTTLKSSTGRKRNISADLEKKSNSPKPRKQRKQLSTVPTDYQHPYNTRPENKDTHPAAKVGLYKKSPEELEDERKQKKADQDELERLKAEIARMHTERVALVAALEDKRELEDLENTEMLASRTLPGSKLFPPNPHLHRNTGDTFGDLNAGTELNSELGDGGKDTDQGKSASEARPGTQKPLTSAAKKASLRQKTYNEVAALRKIKAGSNLQASGSSRLQVEPVSQPVATTSRAPKSKAPTPSTPFLPNWRARQHQRRSLNVASSSGMDEQAEYSEEDDIDDENKAPLGGFTDEDVFVPKGLALRGMPRP
ncbi:uncharacterized protein BXZ73DRAFT_80538, partial [Epithele typhae]|uniref:uncharacterized protein n=1 Tax=Epithele typhae TaxID=378194 RepID=UPI002007B310